MCYYKAQLLNEEVELLSLSVWEKGEMGNAKSNPGLVHTSVVLPHPTYSGQRTLSDPPAAGPQYAHRQRVKLLLKSANIPLAKSEGALWMHSEALLNLLTFPVIREISPLALVFTGARPHTRALSIIVQVP